MAPQRVAGAVTVSPYTYDARQERGLALAQSQVSSTTLATTTTATTSTVTENADRGTHGKGKKPKAKPRAERNPRQEEEIRFNTGPRNLRATQVNRGGRRGFRMPGRSYAEDQNGIPDYPPPSFQEAMTTPPVSVCSSTTSLPLAPALPLVIPENIPEDPRESMDHPAVQSAVSELHAADNDLDFEGTMFVIDRNSVPVCSTDLPRGAALEERVKIDWLKRRGVEFPGKSSADVSSSSRLGDGVDAPGRGRSTRRLLTPLLIDPEPKSDGAGLPTPTSSAKRRFLSLSPLRTIFPPRSPTQQDRATLSAHPSPSSSPYPTSRSLFFRSSSSLATASFLRLPLLSSPILGKSELLSRKIFKGKDRGKQGTTQDPETFDAWELLNEDAYAGVDEDGKESTGHPRSLLSAVESIQSYPNGDTSPTRSQIFTFGTQVSDASRTRRPLVVPEATDEERHALCLPQVVQETPMRDWKGPSTAFIDRPLHRSRSPVPGVVETSSNPAIPHRNPILSASDYTPPLNPGPSLVSVRARAMSPSPPPSLALKRTAHVAHPSPLRLGAKPNVVVVDQSAAEAAMYQRALDTPLPMTPVFRNHFDHGGSVGAINDEGDDLDMPPSMPLSARTLPSSLTNSVSAHELTFTAPGFATSVPATLSITTHSSATMSSPTQVVKTNSLEEPMTPTRHHYAGRPLPRPPPTNTSRVAVVDSMYASSETPIMSGDKNGSSYNTCPEGLLIDLDDTTLDPLPASGASTPSSAQFSSQAYLPLSQASTSSVDLLAEPPSLNFGSSGSTGHPAVPRQSNALSELTDLDLLVSQLADEDPNGTDYEKLLLLSEVLGPATTTTTPNPNPSGQSQVGSSSGTSLKTDPPQTNGNISLIGRIEVKRRRTTKEGIVKLKLTLLDVSVNKCGICLFQFKEGDVGALTSACQHSFHESCLGRWHARSKTCPLCRVPLDTDVR